MMKQVLPLLLVLLALAGIIDSFALTGAILFDEGRCLEGAGCQSVLSSKYATVFGVSWTALGLVHYTTLLALSLTLAFAKVRWSLYLITALAGAGVVVSSYLVYLQGIKIGEWCPLCLISAALQVLIFGTSATLWRQTTSEDLPGRLRIGGIIGVTTFSLLFLLSSFWGITKVDQKLAERGLVGSQDLFATIGNEEVRISNTEGLQQLQYDIAAFGHSHYESWYREHLITRYAKENGFANRAELVDARLAKDPITVTEADIEAF